MNKTILLPLQMEIKDLYLNIDKIKEKKESLEFYLEDEKKMHTNDFAKKVLLSNEVQSNNSVEGYYDDIDKIKEVVKKREFVKR